MKLLKELLGNLAYTCERGELDRPVTAVVYDSRKVKDGCLFVCIRGANFDGHSAAAQAVENGANALVVSAPVTIPKDSGVTVIRVEDVHQFPGHIACDSASRSEIVLPLHDPSGKIRAVLDIDSPVTCRFTEEDQKGLESLVPELEKIFGKFRG